MFTELERVKTKLLVKEEGENLTVIVVGRAKWKDRGKFNSYEDHRMAMAFIPLACIHPVIIRDPDVVSKSYPGFWKDIESRSASRCEKLKMK